MQLDTDTWQRVSELFDTLAVLPPPARQEALAQSDLTAATGLWLERLLEAHDATDPVLIERTLEGILADLGTASQAAGGIDADIVGRRFGAWRTTREIGRGGMGVVLLAERADGQYQKQAAIKLLPNRGRSDDDLRTEIRLLARLEHPDIARLLDGGIADDGLAWLVMEHVDGQPIDLHCRDVNLPLRERIALLARVARAVGYSHRQLVVHRDIKPSNILITRDGDFAKLVDFGIGARLPDETDAQEPLAILARCTPGYASPEQVAGQAPAISDDVFSLGAVLYELVSGKRLRDATATTRLVFGPRLRAARPERPMPEPSTAGFSRHAELHAVCRKALSADAQQRYADADSFAADLDNWLHGRPVSAYNGGRAYRARKWIVRNRWPSAIGTAAVLALLVGSGVALWQAGAARQAATRAETERVRAMAALAETEEARRRAETVSDFLQNLFRAAAPLRPNDQLPSTEKLLALGAERAMDKRLGEPGERLEMLLAIAEVHLGYGHWETAEPLLEAALALARERRNERPANLARILYAQAGMAIGRRQYDQAGAMLLEAEALLPDPQADWNTHVGIRSARGFVEAVAANYTQALELLEPLHAQVMRRDDTPIQLRSRLMSHLALVHKDIGNLDKAAELYRSIDVLLREMLGEEHRDVASNLLNTGLLEYNRGHFADAETLLLESIALFDRILPEEPFGMRAFARRMLAYSRVQQGRFDQGWGNVVAGIEESSQAYGIAPEQLPWELLDRGWMQARIFGRLAEAQTQFARMMTLARERGEEGALYWTWAATMQAWTLCEAGRGEDGSTLLAELDARLGENPPTGFQLRADLHEARGNCLYRTGQHALALIQIEQALAASGARARAVERAACHTLRARSLAALDRPEEAAEALEQAERVFLELDLPQHPHLARIEAVRREMFAESALHFREGVTP